MKHEVRFLFLLIFLVCASLISFALYLQLGKHLLPCPLCVAQRIAYWLAGLTALLAFIHRPKIFGQRIYSAFVALFSLSGMAVAIHHTWAIRHPELAECGISPEEKFLNALPIAQWWPSMFEANGDCTSVTWRFLSLNIPEWSIICFIILTGLAVYIFISKPKRHWLA